MLVLFFPSFGGEESSLFETSREPRRPWRCWASDSVGLPRASPARAVTTAPPSSPTSRAPPTRAPPPAISRAGKRTGARRRNDKYVYCGDPVRSDARRRVLVRARRRPPAAPSAALLRFFPTFNSLPVSRPEHSANVARKSSRSYKNKQKRRIFFMREIVFLFAREKRLVRTLSASL